MKHRMLAFAAAACLAFPSLPVGMLDEMKVYAASTNLPDISADYAEMLGANVVLNGGIGMTFYLKIGEKLNSVLDSAYMSFQIGDSKDAQIVPLKSLTPVTVNGSPCYAVSCQLVARQMNDRIHVKLVLDDKTESGEIEYSVSQYAQSILSDTTGSYTDITKNLVKAMLDYGSYTQVYFNYHASALPNGGTPLTTLPTAIPDTYNMDISGTIPEGLTHYGETLLLQTQTGMRQYFKVDEGHSIKEYTFKLKDESGKKPLEPKENGDLYYVEIPNIAAKNLGTKFTLTVTDENGSEYKAKICPLSYGVNSLGKGKDNLDNVVYALYGYYLAALDYVAESNQMMLDQNYKGLVINEVCSVNTSCLKDNAGNYPDWLELYNGSDHEIELDGIGISDDTDKPFSFTFPENTKIGKGAYLLVYCDSKDTEQFTTSFGLSSSGETLTLTHPEYGLIDTVTFETIDTDLSYARKPDGGTEWDIYHVTPGKSNNSAKSAVPAAAPEFSKSSRFYSGTQSLTLTVPTGCKVYYTLDGSDPTTSTSKIEYNNAISITDGTDRTNSLAACDDFWIGNKYSKEPFVPSKENVPKGTVIKAVAVPTDGSEPSKVVTNTYFVDKNDSFYNDMYVISLSSDPDNFIGEENGILVCGKNYYEKKDNPEYKDLPDYSKENPTNYNSDMECEVTMEVFKNQEPVYSGNVGLQVSGNATRSYRQKSMNLYARAKYGSTSIDYPFFAGLKSEAGEDITSFSKLTLRNGGNDYGNARVRDDIIQNLVADDTNYEEGNEVKVGTLAKCDTVVFLDGEFWGYYSMQEKLCETYVASHYGVKEKNVSIIKSGDEIPDKDGKTDLDSDGEKYMAYAAVASKADMTVAENYETFCNTVDIDSFIDYVAVEAYIANYDWSNELGTNNWFMWRSTKKDGEGYNDGKWRFALYDTEFSTNLYGDNDTRCCHNTDIFSYYSSCPDDTSLGRIFMNLLKNTEFRDRFYARFDEIAKKTFYGEDSSTVSKMVDANVERIKLAVAASSTRWDKHDLDEYAINFLKGFFEKRYNPAMESLDYLLGYKEVPKDDLITNKDNWKANNYDGGDSAMQKTSATEFTIEVKNCGSNYYSVQPAYSGLKLFSGYQYELTYDISCNTNGKLKVNVMQDYDPWIEFYAAVEEPTPSNPVQCKTTFNMTEGCGNARISFDIGNGYNKGTYTISNIQLHCVGKIPTE
ncbi:MAG: CotH kinase family protein [Oscillospiraceae bacterium]|nr:CotH kinase family protein [Oscillospiraceae bacterium]